MNRYIEKQQIKYVIATLDTPTRYLRSLHFGKWEIVEDIEIATKTFEKEDAESLLKYYREDLHDYEKELVIIPIIVTFEIMNENDEECLV